MDGITLAVVGAGLRGIVYAEAAVASGRARVVAVAEPDRVRRERFAHRFGVPAAGCYSDWSDLAAAGRVADAAVISTLDRLHTEPAVAFAGLGYHLLLEKPMAPSEAECLRIAEAVEKAGIVFTVGHVMRYTSYTRRLKEMLDSGRCGQITGVQHLEPIGWWHLAHSFVRGNWRREDESGPLLLTKSCHDLDWLMYVLGSRPTRISSFGSLLHFRPEQAPPGAGMRCTDCAVESECPYSAVRLYVDALHGPRRFWPLGAVTDADTADGVLDALRTGPYGRCVYRCDNDVVDHQVVITEHPGGVTASFTMTAFTELEHRKTRIFGTHGYLSGNGRMLRYIDFRTGAQEIIDTHTGDDASAAGGHGGGDAGLTETFLSAVATRDQSVLGTDVWECVASHRAVWAAERARRSGTVVDFELDAATC
jgi:predicted dehydrogenase